MCAGADVWQELAGRVTSCTDLIKQLKEPAYSAVRGNCARNPRQSIPKENPGS